MLVPYINQIDNAPRANDCGPAAVTMLVGAKNASVVTSATVTTLSRVFDVDQNGTTSADLVRMADYLGVAFVSDPKSSYPYIALVDYRSLNIRYQASGDFGHWIVRLSDTTYHDPLFRGTAGANLTTTKKILDDAEQNARRWSRSVPVRVRYVEEPDMSNQPRKARITGAGGWNVRKSPTVSGSTATGYLLPQGAEFSVNSTVSSEGYTWAKVSVTAGGVTVGDGYVRGDGWRWVTDVTPPPVITPQPTQSGWKHPKYLLGISCLNDANAGFDALARGCRSVLFMDNLMGAADAARKYPDAKIFARFWFQNAPDPVWLADHAGAGLSDIPGNMWTTCANECDWICYGTADELRRRFEYERTFAEAMWRKNPSRKIVIGEFSHGTPDITNPEIVQAFKETYYAFAQKNTGRLQIGWHLYTKGRRFIDTPPVNAEIVAPEWYEGRDASFWQQCGASSQVVHTCGETGVEAGAGGFPWAGYSADQFEKWCSWWLEYRRSLPVVMDGACIFQLGSHPNWRGYDVSSYLGVLTDFWQGRRS